MGVLRFWPLVFIIGVPFIILLYLLKQKIEKHPFSALNLWKEAYQNVQAATPWEKFRNNILMYLQILALLLLIIALMYPYATTGKGMSQNIVLYIDNSASMNSIYQGGRSRLEEARKQAGTYVNNMEDGASVTVIAAAQTAQIKLSGSSDKTAIKRAVEDIPETDLKGSLNSGISLLESMTSQWEDYQIIAFTDSDVNVEDLKVQAIDLSEAGKNVSIDYLSHSVKEDGTADVLAKVTNQGTEAVSSDVNLYLGKELYDIRQVMLKPGESQILYFQPITASRYGSAKASYPVLRAELEEKDILLRDNIAYDILEEDQGSKVLLVTEKNVFLEKVISVIDNVDLKVTNAIENVGAQEYDLIIYDGMIPVESDFHSSILLINPKEEIDSVLKLGKTNKNSKITSKKSEITRQMDRFSFGCSRVTALKKPSWAESFLVTGDDSAGFIGNYKGNTVAALGFDLHNSDFPLQTQFPILMYQLFEKCLHTGILSQNIYETGGIVEWNLPEECRKVTVTGPHGKEEYTGKAMPVSYLETGYSGLYQIDAELSGETIRTWFCTGFPSEESILSEQVTVSGSGKEAQMKRTDAISRDFPLTAVFLGLVLSVLMVEWFFYRKIY